MIAPSEIVYWEILPAIRREIVTELKKMELKQKDIAQLLAITPASVSMYLKNKRGDFEFNEKFLKKVRKGANDIADGSKRAFDVINSLVREFERSKALCSICHDKNETTSRCKNCF